jgi:hypothetical protein
LPPHEDRGRAMSKPSSKFTAYRSRRDRDANRPPKGEAWGWLTWEMMDSAAYRAMSPSARKVFDRIHREHGSQGGKENGRLKVTWRDFQKAGVQPRRITGAIAEVEALGWAVRTFYGRRSCGEDRGAPAQFRLTWLPVFDAGNAMPPTNDWKRFGDDLAEAKRVAQAAAGRLMAQRNRPSHPKVPSQNIEGAVTRGVQKKTERGVQRNGDLRIQRGVQTLHLTGGAEEKITHSATDRFLGVLDIRKVTG